MAEPLEVDLDPQLVADVLANERVTTIAHATATVAFWYVMAHYQWRPDDYRVLLSRLHVIQELALDPPQLAALYLKFFHHYDYDDERIDEITENVCEYHVAKACDRIVEHLVRGSETPIPEFRDEYW